MAANKRYQKPKNSKETPTEPKKLDMATIRKNIVKANAKRRMGK